MLTVSDFVSTVGGSAGWDVRSSATSKLSVAPGPPPWKTGNFWGRSSIYTVEPFIRVNPSQFSVLRPLAGTVCQRLGQGRGSRKERRCTTMRSDRVFEALHTLRNRYMLCQLASKATRKFHRPSTRIQETMNQVLDRIAGSERQAVLSEPENFAEAQRRAA
jgi:hypothetical protein